jgi:hypothetical protein
MTDFDPLASAKRVHDALADRGTILGPGIVVVQAPGSDSDIAPPDITGTVIHHISTETYIDEGGHIHAVLIDEVVTGVQGGGAGTTVIEILSDVPVS